MTPRTEATIIRRHALDRLLTANDRRNMAMRVVGWAAVRHGEAFDVLVNEAIVANAEALEAAADFAEAAERWEAAA